MDFASLAVAAMAVGLLVIFALMLGMSIFKTWTAPSGGPPKESQAFVYIATALAALVGGLMAVAVGQPVVSKNTNQASVTSRSPEGQAAANTQSKISENRFTAKLPEDWQSNLKGLYMLVYVVMGFAAIATWVIKQDTATDTVKNLAVTFFGLAITAVGAAFQVPVSPPK